MNLNESQNDDRLASWRDSMNGEEAPTPTSAEMLSHEQQRQLADEQLLHALLRRHYSDTEFSDAKRVDRVLKAITPRPARPLWFRLMRASLSSAAALVLVVLLIELLLPQTTSATSGFDRVVSAFMDDGDRAYSIQFTMQDMQDTSGDADPSRQSVNEKRPRPMHHRGPGKFPGATLYLRGSKQYVFEIKLPRDKFVWTGQDGQNAWIVRPNRDILVSQDRDAFHLPFFEEMTTIPLLDVRDTLQAARHGYELDPPKKVTMENGREADYFVAHRDRQEGFRPQRIELWADPHTGLLYRIVCSKIHFGGMVCRQMRMDYLNSNPLPANWFEYSGHAASDATVKTVTKQDVQQLRHKHHKMRQERWNRQPHRRPWNHRQNPTDEPPPPPPDANR